MTGANPFASAVGSSNFSEQALRHDAGRLEWAEYEERLTFGEPRMFREKNLILVLLLFLLIVVATSLQHFVHH